MVVAELGTEVEAFLQVGLAEVSSPPTGTSRARPGREAMAICALLARRQREEAVGAGASSSSAAGPVDAVAGDVEEAEVAAGRIDLPGDLRQLAGAGRGASSGATSTTGSMPNG